MTCDLCKKRGKDWDGDDPRCAFEDGQFSSDNWNCATANAIRDICYEGQVLPPGVDYRYCDDMKYASINISEICEPWFGMCLWVAWYKQRGGTDAMWILDSEDTPRPPTEQECRKIVDWYANRAKERT